MHHVNKQNQQNETWRNHLKEDLNDSNQRAMFFPDNHQMQGPVGEEETYCASKKVEQQPNSEYVNESSLLVESIAIFELSDHCIPSFSHQTQADIR